MKRILLLSITVFISVYLHAQNVSINTTGDPAASSAMLDISSTDKGILVPRMAGFQRAMIISPAQGLLVYDTDSRSFWFYDGGWNELGGGGSSGQAGGDLSGNYPTPNVVKLQNLDVSADFPFDKTVLKWDAISNNWKGRNDSLFLPYNAVFSNPQNLFSVTNNFNGFSTSSAILGRRLTGSGINLPFSTGIWGDASTGAGVVGTSTTHAGIYGYSSLSHGAEGSSDAEEKAGIYGMTTAAGGFGVMGQNDDVGIAVYGKSTGGNSIAGRFENTNTAGQQLALDVRNYGLGMSSFIFGANPANQQPTLKISNLGLGHGLQVEQAGTAGAAISSVHEGGGMALYAKSTSGIPGKFEITNATNSYPVLMATNTGTGTSLYVSSSNTGLTGNVVDVLNSGTGNGLSVLSTKGTAANFTIDDAAANKTNMIVQQNGTGRGIYVNQNNVNATLPALDVISQGTKGALVQVNGNNAIAITGSTGATANNTIGVKGVTAPNATNGIGVLGQAGFNDPNGIGVKGIAGGNDDGGIGVLGETSENTPLAIAVKGIGYTHNEDVGAITGINMVDGVGVLGESLGTDGIGVVGIAGNTDKHNVAAMFKNNYNNNNRAVVEIQTNGKGNGIYLDHDQLNNTAPLFRMRNAGTGQFLRFENGLGDIKTTLSKEGNLTTDGTITVRSDKGIVRNSTSTQLRMEIVTAYIPSGSVSKYDEFNAPDYIEVDFGTAFASPPAVSLGNLVSGSIGLLTLTIEDVTTTGCNIVLWNYTGHDWNYVATTYKLIVVGAE